MSSATRLLAYDRTSRGLCYKGRLRNCVREVSIGGREWFRLETYVLIVERFQDAVADGQGKESG